MARHERQVPTCSLPTLEILAFGGMPCAALCEWAQIRSLSIWTVNIVAFLINRVAGLNAGNEYPGRGANRDGSC